MRINKGMIIFIIAIVLSGALLVQLFTGLIKNNQSPQQFLDENETRIYYFYSPECSACREVTPLMKNISKKYNIVFCNVKNLSDTQRCYTVADKIQLEAVPTVALEGEEKTLVGKEEISTMVKSLRK